MKERPLYASIALGLIVAILFWVSLKFLWVTRAVALMLFLGVIFGVTLSGGVTKLNHRFGMKRSIAAVLLLFGVIGAIVGVGWLLAPQVGKQMSHVTKALPDAIDRLEDSLRKRTIGGVAITPPDLSSPRVLRKLFAGNSQTLGKMLFPFLTNSIAAIGGLVVVIFLALYIAIDPKLYRNGFVRLFPPRRRERVGEVLDELTGVVRQWLVARLLAMVAIGIITAVALWIAGIPAFAALGAIAGLLEFIPLFGPIAAAIPAIAMALLISPTKALWVVVIFLIIQQIEGNVVTPLLLQNRVDVPPLITIVAVTALGMVFGIIGMLIAEPLAAIAIAVAREVWVVPMEETADGATPA
jgi:predicted PurR-regulated permease PerM